jgi:hypothetical protein
MTDKKLSLPETAALIVLMAEAREVTNPELKRHYGWEIDKKSRDRLRALKLIECRKQGRAFVHVLTDAGWARVAEDFRSGVSVGSGSPRAIILALTAGLGGFMRHSGHSLADLFSEQEPPGAETPPGDDVVPADSDAEALTEGPATGAPGGNASPPSGPAGEIEARIRTAYSQLAAEPGAWVSLTRIRPLLEDLAKGEVDAVLVHMNQLPDVNIVPESNQKTLTARDRDAAVTIGDQDKHLIWVG